MYTAHCKDALVIRANVSISASNVILRKLAYPINALINSAINIIITFGRG